MHLIQKSTLRVESIDYFRGLVALSIVAYHMHLFTFGDLDSETILGKFNTYRVSFFYILSGITLHLVYSEKLHLNRFDLSNFYIRRFFRIVPLLWLATIITVIFQFDTSLLSLKKIIANITIIPGAFKPETFIASGAWSVGDELFFYIFFPIIIFLTRINKIYLFVLLFVSFLLLALFGFYIFDPTVELGDQWSKYVNPMGQIFFFIAGITLSFVGTHLKNNNVLYFTLFCVVFYLFTTHDVSGNSINLITGSNRMILTLYTLILCFSFYKFDFSFLPKLIKRVLQFFGDISYSLYLLHPIAYFMIKDVLAKLGVESGHIQIITTVVCSIIISYLTYEYFEKYYIKVGKKYYRLLETKLRQRSLRKQTIEAEKEIV